MSLTHLFRHWTYQVFAPGALLRSKYNAFKELLSHDEACLELIAELEEIHYHNEPVDWARVVRLTGRLREQVRLLAARLADMNPVRHMGFDEYLRKVEFYVQMGVELPAANVAEPHIVALDDSVPADPALAMELVGGKAANLARAMREQDARVPPGFVITSNCCHYILEFNELRVEIDDRLARVDLADFDAMGALCAQMRALVMSAELPPALEQALIAAATQLAGPDGLLAVRSSAVAEDGDISFAGQYASELGVPASAICRAYRRVLAAKYTPKALSYRILHGLSDLETPMAALVMPLIDARAAGVAYTRVKERGGEECMAVYAVPGLGTALVDGQARPEVHRLTRADPPRLIEVAARRGSSEDAEVVAAPLLSSPAAKDIARVARGLEECFGCPQDVEWAVDRDGVAYVLQTRTLQEERGAAPSAEMESDAREGELGEELGDKLEAERPLPEILLSGAEVAASGTGCGLVTHMDSVMDVSRIEPGAVLVVRTLSPALARVVRRAAGVVSASGSRASHLASVAREFGLPVLVVGEEAFTRLEQDQLVTVDGASAAVYAGCVEPLLRQARARKPQATPFSTRLGRIMPRISHLTLTDPDSDQFAPDKWYSLHDVVRYAHEKAVSEMFSLVDRGGRGLSGARQLKSSLPIVLYLLDLEGGLFDDAADKDEITPNDIKSLPLWALWWGLSSEDIVWPADTVHIDWEEFDKVSAGIFRRDSRLLASYAVTSENYLHLTVRFGYHFAVVDSLCGADANANYVNFRFMGGGGGPTGRRLRLCFIRRALEEHGFTATLKGDLLDASLAREDMNVLQRKLAVLGYLLARTRLMDMQLKDEEQLEAEVGAFRAAVARFARPEDS